jgi:hypothetical protein
LASPNRLVDTRRVGGPLAGGATRTEQLTALAASAPPGAQVTGVVMNATVNQPTVASYLTIFPAGSPRPETSSLNMAARQDVPNLALAMLGPGHGVNVFNFAGSTHYLFDATAVVLG